MPLMSEKKTDTKESAIAGSKRVASKATSQQASAAQASKRSKK